MNPRHQYSMAEGNPPMARTADSVNGAKQLPAIPGSKVGGRNPP